ncbi:nitroreductase family deazaflavin-dependent oxidoreductase [Mycobacterium intermedium]|uniref:Nitroreductase family deazaflavin-dependent oxidoreductase n=1 Tax=Mycobacterium intermedium TaxID=28445 RepID=A0A1E3SI91_MYCIE|nr:hypothetical protein [Mycobacterium intermedium]MCV6964392.1 nitroreductase family deazaflavin-dependent oxidoreductase [Mycobacterium intermedium]ODR01876.1 hypothetical protein BHQ20_07080 [Mycobacterium intermedium]OPE47512.1 nitroreductase family deazaflavin-dependent oxidoreductase [Mycobacterium intermedium]ORB08606.1 nitroreductase family deazaflavin-dependent oxidoreductase [Mycobacterium intermedium]
MAARYEKPNGMARAANSVIRYLAERGISVAGTRALRVRGRKTGKMRAVVINLLTVDGVDYVVSPRGETQWARNVRAAGVVELGPRRPAFRSGVSAAPAVPTAVREVADDDKPELLRRYLARWYWQVKGYVLGLTPESTDDELRAAAPLIPVFALVG